MDDPRIQDVKNHIAGHPDFPIQGITFRDFLPVIRDPVCFRKLIDVLTEHIRSSSGDVELIVGLESRGFIIGPVIAQALNIGFVPVRKAGKLPGKTHGVEYTLEYGKDKFEIQQDSVKAGQKVVIMDDLLATGGTMRAACQLMDKAQAEVLECVVIIELPELRGRDKVPYKTTSFIDFKC